MPDEVLTIKEIAALLKLAQKTVYAMANAGELPPRGGGDGDA
jgi:excisionase family DNA binding protein